MSQQSGQNPTPSVFSHWEADPDSETRRPIWQRPGLYALVALAVLAALVVAGILTNRSDDGSIQPVTIAELRGHPDRYDKQTVVLRGTVEEVMALPVLEQYALYTFRDETGSMRVLTQRGTPPGDGEQIELTAVYYSSLTLDEQLRQIIDEQFGSLAGGIVDEVLPSLSLNVVFLDHQHYQPLLAPTPVG
jgi:hypothetical protein